MTGELDAIEIFLQKMLSEKNLISARSQFRPKPFRSQREPTTPELDEYVIGQSKYDFCLWAGESDKWHALNHTEIGCLFWTSNGVKIADYGLIS
ncbi:hypothetical protein A2704_04600 [Candidatus Kaiserbacteria bacterium RIFCSPHIGHO2_01_FULL_54_36b]|nr:MAG: hypothetical protein A2704_04600 [Candidatus Kaiserbacteria bacterium RIFCSPHIGHO2_01_FULL_54_36b]